MDDPRTTRIGRRRLLAGAGGVALAALAAPHVRAQNARKLVFWHGYTQKPRADFMREVADRFEAANPGVKVEIEVVPWSAQAQKWPAALTGGTLPDVAIVLAENAVPMHLAGALHPADPVVQAVGGADAFKPGVLDGTGRFQGQYVSLPHYVHNRILIYRKDRLAEAGLKPPVSWDDALQAAVATTKAPAQFGWILKLSKGDTGGGYLLWMLARSANASLYDVEGNVTLDSAGVKDAVNYMVELAKRASGPGALEYKISDNFSLVNSGRTSLTEDSAAIVAAAAADAPAVAEQLDATFMPRRERVGNLMAGISVALPKGRNAEDGRRFAAFLFAEENYIPFLHTIPLFMFPALQGADNPTFYAQPTIARFRNVVDVTLKGLETASLPGMEHGINPYAAQIFNAHIVENMFQRILVDNQAVDAAIGTAASAMATVIRDTKRRLGKA